MCIRDRPWAAGARARVHDPLPAQPPRGGRSARPPRARGTAHPRARPPRRRAPGERRRVGARAPSGVRRAAERAADRPRRAADARHPGPSAEDRRLRGPRVAADDARRLRDGLLRGVLELHRSARVLRACGIRRGRSPAGGPARGQAQRRGDAGRACRADRSRASLGGGSAARLLVSEADALLEVAVEAARMAGALLSQRVRSGRERTVTSKSTPTDLVSEADLESERAIKALLAKRRPDDGFVGEEGGEEPGSSGLSWVVDPLDGTVNFLFGIPQWCVSVAVRDAEGAVAGAVYDPNREELFTATREGLAMLARAGESIELNVGAVSAAATYGAQSGDGDLSTAMVATGLAYDAAVRGAQAQVLAGLIPRVRDLRRFGSAALDLAWTAMGL